MESATEKALDKFYNDLKANRTIIPDEVTDYLLQTSGFQSPDPSLFCDHIHFLRFIQSSFHSFC